MNENQIPIATHEGDVKIGDATIHCAVLDDESNTRVLIQSDFLTSIGRSPRPTSKKGVVEELPPFLTANNLKPFINNELRSSTKPIMFKSLRGGGLKGGIYYGYKAELLPRVCQVYLEARDAGILKSSQIHIAESCDILVRGLATVGIIALVDEATGFQDDRVKSALAKILEEFLLKEAKPYIGTFPIEFYKQIFRLNRWPWNEESTKRPGVIGRWTNDIVYERLAPGILKALQERNPTIKPGRRKYKHFQFLDDEVGDPRLKSHFDDVLALMRAASNWRTFKSMLNRAFPKYHQDRLLPFFENYEDCNIIFFFNNRKITLNPFLFEILYSEIGILIFRKCDGAKPGIRSPMIGLILISSRELNIEFSGFGYFLKTFSN